MTALAQNVLTVTEEKNRLVIRLDLDGFRYADLQQEANRITGQIHRTQPEQVVINLEGVHYLNSITIGVIVRMARQAEARGASVSLCNGVAAVQEILRTMNLTRLWSHYESLDAAIASIEPS